MYSPTITIEIISLLNFPFFFFYTPFYGRQILVFHVFEKVLLVKAPLVYQPKVVDVP